MKPIRVLVIDDSAFMRKIITDILEKDYRIEVIGTARNGRDGVKKVKELSPDVVTLDIHMPVLDGLTALQEIMATEPLPIIMLSNDTDYGAEHTIRAMESGAVDFIKKPSGEISLNIETIQEEIITKVITAARATKWTRITKDSNKMNTNIISDFKLKERMNPLRDNLVAIGTSTGGPNALQQVITKLPKDMKTPILIVQHMPPGFTKSLATRLNNLTNLHVKEAENGERIEESSVYVAPGDFHMEIEKTGAHYSIKLTKGRPLNNHRPAVDALFCSLATIPDLNKIAVVLTGMGNDGAFGIRTIKEADKHAFIISEAESTSVIYGMPRAARETGLVDRVLPLNDIGHFLGSIDK